MCHYWVPLLGATTGCHYWVPKVEKCRLCYFFSFISFWIAPNQDTTAAGSQKYIVLRMRLALQVLIQTVR